MIYTLPIYLAIIAVVILVALGKFKPTWWLVHLITLGAIWPVTTYSDYLIGTDLHLEAYFAYKALDGWWIDYPNPANSAIGVVGFTPLFAKLGIPIEVTFKWIMPAVFAFTPAILYSIYKRYVTDKEAFLSVVYFIAFPAVLMEITAITREMVASVFLALFLFAILSRLPKKYKLLAMTGSGLAVILFHYSLGLILLALLLMYIVFMAVFKLFKCHGYTPIWISVIVLLVVGTFGTWYYSTVAAGTPLRYFTALIPIKETQIGFLKIGWLPNEDYKRVLTGIPPEDRMFEENGIIPKAVAKPKKNANGYESGVLEPSFNMSPHYIVTNYDALMQTALGLDFMRTSTVGKAFRIIQYVTQILLLIGLIYFFVRFRRLKFPIEYLALSMVCVGLLLMCLVVPGFSSILNATRWFHIALFMLSPMIVLGMKCLLRVKES